MPTTQEKNRFILVHGTIADGHVLKTQDSVLDLLNSLHEENEKFKGKIKYLYLENERLMLQSEEKDSPLIKPSESKESKHWSDALRSSSDSEPEILDWKQAARLWSEGVETERRVRNDAPWHPMLDHEEGLVFHKSYQYRRKPLPVEPDWTLDQGFKEGDIVMVKDDNDYNTYWSPRVYLKYSGCHIVIHGAHWNQARPLTSEEYKKLKVMP